MRLVVAAALGAVIAFSLNGALSVFAFGYGLPGGWYWTYTNDRALVLLLTLLPLSAHLLGGAVSGVLSRSASGLSGALSVVLSALVAVAEGLYFGLSLIFDDPITRAENAGFLMTFGVLFLLYFPFTVLAGYLGGRAGGRLRPTARS